MKLIHKPKIFYKKLCIRNKKKPKQNTCKQLFKKKTTKTPTIFNTFKGKLKKI